MKILNKKKQKVKIPFTKLCDVAHRIAYNDGDMLLNLGTYKDDSTWYKFIDREAFIEAYGLAEETLYDEVGPFVILDSPKEYEFQWNGDIIKVKEDPVTPVE